MGMRLLLHPPCVLNPPAITFPAAWCRGVRTQKVDGLFLFTSEDSAKLAAEGFNWGKQR